MNSRLYYYLTDEDILGSEQAGFRPQHSTLDHILALHILSRFYIDQRKRLFCAFVDYSKAFDFIERAYLWQKLISTNITGKVLTVIRKMYENAKSQVIFNNTLSDPFPCEVGVRQGENLSPLLFAIYLNDFNTFLSTRYGGLTKITDSISNELQIYLRIFCLLYADDTLVLAESAKELQNALNALHSYCNQWALNVNIDKTKVVIFSRGKVRKHKSFVFGNETIDVVDDYVYLGTTFNYNGTFHKAKTKQSTQAMKATFSLITKIKQLNLSIETSIELIDVLIIPIFLYGAEIWGFEPPKQIQIKFNGLMRKLLHLHKKTSMTMINGELGIKEISEYIENRMLNFWHGVATGDENKISTMLYKWLHSLYEQNKYKSVWITKIKESLSRINMSSLFNEVSDVNRHWFKSTVKIRLKDVYGKEWSEAVANNSACINYQAMSKVKKMQNYLLKLPKRYAYALCKLKCGNHHMPIVTGRYSKVPINERKCNLCQCGDIGDEFHYLLKCPFFEAARTKYLKTYYYTHPSRVKMQQLFESTDSIEMLNLAKLSVVLLNQFKK